MKRTIVVVAGVIALTVSGLALAKDKDMMEGKGGMMGMMDGKMEDKGCMMKKGHAMMDRPSMVAVKDGIVILSGTTLTKFDNKLNLITEVDLKAKKPCCKMMENMIKAQADGDEEAEAALEEAAQEKPAVDHAAHH